MNKDEDAIVAERYDILIRNRDLETLVTPNWLNDEIIEFGLNAVLENVFAEARPCSREEIFDTVSLFLR